MTTHPPSDSGLEKVAAKLPIMLRQALKIRCAQVGTGMQEAVAEAVTAWRLRPAPLPKVATGSATSFTTWLPPGLYDGFRTDCGVRGVSYTQGLAQAVTLWLGIAEAAGGTPTAPSGAPVRTAVCHPRNGTGKTMLASSLARSLARSGLRVLLVDYDPEGWLTRSTGFPVIGRDRESLVTHMLHRRSTTRPLAELVHDIPREHSGGLIRLLPAATDGYLLDSGLALLREPRQAALERALAPLEPDYDAVVLDCPSNLGLAVEAALYYTRPREGGGGGIAVPAGRAPAAGDARELLLDLIQLLSDDWQLALTQEGIRVTERADQPVPRPHWFSRRTTPAATDRTSVY
ncbi:ParA family protein [Streptomyces sp. NPDC058469]|uniref:ParA family protein n=1 Tax=Streptomyces sp. NPDC058469 TaxID=3346514 RepID=UPI00364880F7